MTPLYISVITTNVGIVGQVERCSGFALTM